MKVVTFEGIKIKLDRPKGTVHTGKDSSGKPWARTYKYDYGFIPKTNGGDSEGIDVFLGPDEDNSDTAYWIAQNKEDGTFDEYKVFLGFKSKAAAKTAYREHIPAKYMSKIFSVSIPMMKAMLGLEPLEKLSYNGLLYGMLSELQNIGAIDAY